MSLAQVAERPYGRYRLDTYEWAPCQVSYTEAECGDEHTPQSRMRH